jgi:hypothetical protein
MSLFLNNEDLRGCIPANVSFSLENLEPFLVEVESTILVRHMGYEEYSRLLASFVAPNMAVDQELLALCRRVAAPLALSNYLPWGEVQISDVGVTTVSKSSDRTAAYAYQVDNLNQSALRMGFNALETLIAYLEKNATEEKYSYYFGSAEHLENTRLLLPSAVEFSRYYPIFESRLTYYAIRSTISSLQDETLIPVLTQSLFDKLKTNASTGENALSIDEKALRDRACKWLAFKTIVEVMQLQLSVELNAGGLRVNYGSMFSNTYKYYTPPSDAQRSIAVETAKERSAGLWSEIGSLLDTINGVEPAANGRTILVDKATVLF